MSTTIWVKITQSLQNRQKHCESQNLYCYPTRWFYMLGKVVNLVRKVDYDFINICWLLKEPFVVTGEIRIKPWVSFQSSWAEVQPEC